MKTVKVYIQEYCDSMSSKVGNYILVLEKDKIINVISNGSIENTTNYRMIISGVISAIKVNKETVKLDIYTTTAFGLSKIKNKKGEFKKEDLGSHVSNYDLLNELKYLLQETKHDINYYVDTKLVKSIVGKESKVLNFGKKNETIENNPKVKTVNNKTNKVEIDLSDEMFDDLTARAKTVGLPKEHLIRFALNQYLYGK